MANSRKSPPIFTLYRGFKGTGHYVWSPFVVKVEARLRFAGLSYRNEAGSPMSGPRGKIPYLTVSFPDPAPQPPSTLADSTFISRQLVSEGWADDLNADLSPFEQAQDLSIRALLEDKLYFYGVYERWEQNYYTMRPGTLAALPYPMQVVVGAIAYRKTHSTLYGQGTGRLTPKEITGLKTQVWESVEAMLSEARGKSRGKKGLFWLLGKNEPTEADTTLFGFIASGLVCAAAPETKNLLKNFPTIMQYAQGIHDRYFPDYEQWE